MRSGTVQVRSEKGSSTIVLKSGGKGVIDWQQADGSISGFWFETVAGHALARAGIKGVQTSVATRWSEALEARHLERHQMITHKSEMDVVFWFNNDYHLVSCKAMAVKELDKHCAEARGHASILGRFSIPFLAFALYDGEPYEHNGVHVFGYRTLVNPAALTGLFTSAINSRRTTAG